MNIRIKGLWCLTPLSNNILVISWQYYFIGGGNWRTMKKPPTCCKSMTNFIFEYSFSYSREK
jgi:hypothetical protein